MRGTDARLASALVTVPAEPVMNLEPSPVRASSRATRQDHDRLFFAMLNLYPFSSGWTLAGDCNRAVRMFPRGGIAHPLRGGPHFAKRTTLLGKLNCGGLEKPLGR